MLKRNLIAIAIISLALIFTSNAFGQNNQRKRTKAKVATTNNSTTTTTQRTTKARADHPVQDDVAYRKNPTSKSKFKKTIKRKRTNNQTTNPRKRPTVRNLENPNGGLDTTDETSEFGSGERNAKPRDLVKNKPEAKPALLEFQIPEKVVTDNKHPKLKIKGLAERLNRHNQKDIPLTAKARIPPLNESHRHGNLQQLS